MRTHTHRSAECHILKKLGARRWRDDEFVSLSMTKAYYLM